MKPKSAIQKGKELENYVAQQLIAKGLDHKAYRSHGSGSGIGEKADIWTSVCIFGRNLGIECKNQKNIKLGLFWEQAKKLEVLGREPVLIFKRHGQPMEDSRVLIYLNTFLDLVKAENNKVDDIKSEIKENNHYDKIDGENKIKYGVEMIKQGLKKLK